MQVQTSVPTYLYHPKENKVSRILQLPDEQHPFVGFKEHFHLLGYLAIDRELSPLYRPSASYPSVNSEHDVLEIVGILAIPHNGGIMFSEVYQKRGTCDGAIMLTINSELSRPNVLGQPSLVWPVNTLKDYIRFNQAQFPDGFPPFATVEAMHEFTLPAPPPTIEVAPFPHLLEPPPPATDQEFDAAYLSSVPPSVGASWPDLDYDIGTMPPGSEDYQENSIASGYHPMVTNAVLVGNTHLPPPTLVFHEHIVWKGQDIRLTSDYKSDITDSLRYSHWNRPLFLTKCLYLASLWIGLANPWDLPEKNYRVLVTNCFLSALDLSETTIENLCNSPLIVTNNSGEFKSSIGWNTLRLTFSNHIANRTSEMRKVVRACIVFHTGFSGITKNEKDDRVDYFYRLLNSDQREQVQQGISEIVELQMFIELLWFALFQPTSGLVKDNNHGRIADLFPEEVRCNEVLGIGVVVTLMTLVYQTLHQWHMPNAKGRHHTITYDVMMYASRGMYDDLDRFPSFRNAVRKLPFVSAANVFPIDPKNGCPRGRVETPPRIFEHIEPIAEVNHHLLSLPNAVFSSIRSQKANPQAHDSCFDQ